MEEAHKTERRLAAILSADVYGYSRRMADNEAATVTDLKQCREIIDAQVREHHGRIVDAPGDNVLAEFPSAVEAVQCGVEVQRELTDRNGNVEPARRMEFRIGIHVGDVILDDGKIYGDGVNIAARLEGLAQPGGICLSAAAHEQIRGKLDVDCEDIGERHVKNIPRPVRVLRVRMAAMPAAAQQNRRPRRQVVIGSVASMCLLAAIAGAYIIIARHPRPASSSALPAVEPSKATIAVLPFSNLSASKDDEYFSDGVTDEIRGDLSKISGLQVTARTSSYAFKGQNEDVKKIARLLSVRNVLEGSVQRSAGQIRIEVELIDASNGFSVWSERYDEKLANVFQIQSEVAKSVARSLKIRLLGDEKARVENKPTENLDAYNLFLVAEYSLRQMTETSSLKAIECLKQAIEKDPKFAEAYAELASAYQLNADWAASVREIIPKARAAAERAVELNPSLGGAHGALGMALFQSWDYAGGEREFKLALDLDPNNAGTHGGYGWCLTAMGRGEEALAQLQLAKRLDPLWPFWLQQFGDAHLVARQYERALGYFQEEIAVAPDSPWGYESRGLVRWSQGKIAEALPDFEKAATLADYPTDAGTLGEVYGLIGRRADALKILKRLKEQSTRRYVTPIAFFAVYTGLGDKDEAFKWLQKAYDDRSAYLLWLRMPVYDSVRSDRRFQAIYKKVGLPE